MKFGSQSEGWKETLIMTDCFLDFICPFYLFYSRMLKPGTICPLHTSDCGRSKYPKFTVALSKTTKSARAVLIMRLAILQSVNMVYVFVPS